MEASTQTPSIQHKDNVFSAPKIPHFNIKEISTSAQKKTVKLAHTGVSVWNWGISGTEKEWLFCVELMCWSPESSKIKKTAYYLPNFEKKNSKFRITEYKNFWTREGKGQMNLLYLKKNCSMFIVLDIVIAIFWMHFLFSGFGKLKNCVYFFL